MKLILFFLLAVGTYSLSWCMNGQCLICLDKLVLERHLTLNCTHSYHQNCWTEWELEENTRIITFQSIREQFDDDDGPGPLETLEISGIRCPLCKGVVEYDEIIYGAAVDSEVIKQRLFDKLAGTATLVRNSGTLKVNDSRVKVNRTAVDSEIIKKRLLDKLAGTVTLVRNSGTIKANFGR